MTLKVHNVWDFPRRLFHWLNVLFILALITIGLIMQNKAALGITGLPAKIGLKQLHVIIGYGFSLNVLFRLCWGWFAAKHQSLKHRTVSFREIKNYQTKIAQGQKPQYLGHTPLGRVSVTVMFILLVVVMLSGLIRAGTDIYYPPFGSLVQDYVAQTDVDSRQIKPYDNHLVDQQKLASIKPAKSLIGSIHKYCVYLLMLMIILHVWAVIKTELSVHQGIVSAMISGKKTIEDKAEDE